MVFPSLISVSSFKTFISEGETVQNLPGGSVGNCSGPCVSELMSEGIWEGR